MSHDSDSAVAFTYSSRSPLRLFGFHSDVQCHRAEIWYRLEGVGQVPWDDTGLDGRDRLVTSAL